MTPSPRSSNALPFFSTRRHSAMYSSPYSPVPLHLLPHPRYSFLAQQLRHRSTFLSRRTHQSARILRYYIGAVVARQYQSQRTTYPRRIKSTRMHRRTEYIRERLLECRRAFNSYPSARSDHDWTKKSVEALRAESDRIKQLTHIDNTGAARMVEISGKSVTKRSATAVASLCFSDFKTYEALVSQQVVKGDAIAVARLAAIQAAKKTSDLVPLAHPSLGITAVDVQLKTFKPDVRSIDRQFGLMAKRGGVRVTATVKCEGKTGVEMEAITAATVGAVTMYDMLKAIDKGMVIMGARVIRKKGGKSGGWTWDEKNNKLVKDEAVDASISDEMPKAAEHMLESNDPKADLSEVDKAQLQRQSSEIEEWNQGLADEFSTEATAAQNKVGEIEPESIHPVESELGLGRKISEKSGGAWGKIRRVNAARQIDDPLRRSAPASTRSGPGIQPGSDTNIPRTEFKRKTQLKSSKSNTDSIADILATVKALESRLLVIQNSNYMSKSSSYPGINSREAQMDTADEWHPATMSPIRREDLSADQDRVDAKGLEASRKKRYENAGGGGAGSVIR